MAIDQDFSGGRTGYVSSDNVAGAALAVGHVAELGHRRIALIGGPTDTRPGVDRLLGYRRELGRLGLESRPGWVVEGDFYPDSGYRAMQELLAEPEPPTAVFAASDLMAAGALRTLEERGIRVPEDVSLLGFDDIPLAALLRPALSTVHQDGEALGRAAGEALLQMVAEPERAAPTITVPVELVLRGSTGPVPTDAPREGEMTIGDRSPPDGPGSAHVGARGAQRP
jgi:LacI family transcriptional regulator